MLTLRKAAAALAAAAVLSAVGAAVPSTAAAQGDVQSGGLGIRLAEAPADRRDDPRAQDYVVDHVQPGTSLTRQIEVINSTDGPLTAQLYVGPAEVRGGAFLPADKGGRGDLSSWSSVEEPSMPLAAGQRRQTRVTIDVPTDASDGERYGAIWAELPAVDSAGVGQVNRVGIRIYLSVGEGGEPASDFTIDSLQASRSDAGEPMVTARVTNTGGRALDMSGSLELTEGPGGLSAGPFPAQLGTTLGVGQTQPVTVVLDEAIDGGPWLATLTLQSGRLERAAEARITFPDEAGASADPVAAQAIGGDNPWVIVAGALIGLLALLLLLYFLLRRRKRRPEDDEETQPVATPA